MIKIKIDRDYLEDKADDFSHEVRWLLDDNMTIFKLAEKILSEYDLPINKWSGYSWSLYINKEKCAYINKYNKNIEYHVDKNKNIKDCQIGDDFINVYLKIENDNFLGTLVLIFAIIIILTPFIIGYLHK